MSLFRSWFAKAFPQAATAPTVKASQSSVRRPDRLPDRRPDRLTGLGPAVSGFGVSGFSLAGLAGTPGIDAYRGNVIAYRCVSLIARSAASVPWLLYRRQRGGGRVEVTDHPLLTLLRRPNPACSGAVLREGLASYLVLTGNAFAAPLRFANGAIGELHLIPPDRVRVERGDGGLPRYRLQDGAGLRDIASAPYGDRPDLLHLRRFAPSSGVGGGGQDWCGQGDVLPTLAALRQHERAGLWNEALLENGARPSLALVYEPKDGSPAQLTDEQFQRLREELHALHAGSRQAGSVMVLDGGLTARELSINPKDMDWLAGKKLAAIEIAVGFGVPAQLVGIPEAQTYANMEQARLAFWEETVLPLLRLMVAEFNHWLAPDFEENLEFDLDLDQVPALLERRFALYEKLENVSFLSAEEKRILLGYGGPVPGP